MSLVAVSTSVGVQMDSLVAVSASVDAQRKEREHTKQLMSET